MRTDRDYADSIELVEAVMEWIGMRWTTSMIKRELREWFGKDLSFMTCNYLIKAANAEIRKRYNIDPQHYKGVQIEFYESILRNKHEKTKNKLTAAERLDKLFGLEQISGDDPDLVASKIRDGLKEMRESVTGGQSDAGDQESIKQNKQRSENGREGDNDTTKASNGTRNVTSDGEQTGRGDKKTDSVETEQITEDNNIPKEVVDEISNIDKKDFLKFRKDKN